MTATVRNFDDLKDAVFEYANRKDTDEPLVLIFQDSMNAHRFVVTPHGIAKQDCDRQGRVMV